MNSPEFTGERFIPGQGGAQIAYEHLHRYRFALRWAWGQDVLDVATGIGYGAALLASAARRVWAVDLDAASVLCGRRTYRSDNLLFLQGDATSLPVRSRSFALVTAFEVLEHVENQEGLVAELARALQPGGVVMISTPNKASYTDARDYHNPFHVREFYREEFLALLQRHFDSIQLVNQQVRAGSLIQNPEESPGAGEIIAEPLEGARVVDAAYFLAFCRIGAGAETVPAASAFLDTGDGYLREWERRLRAAGAELERLNREVEERSAWGRELNATLAARDQVIVALQGEMEQEIQARDQEIVDLQEEMKREFAARDAIIAQLRQEFDERGRWARHLDAEIAARDERIRSAQNHLAEIQGRRAYRVLRRMGLLPE